MLVVRVQTNGRSGVRRVIVAAGTVQGGTEPVVIAVVVVSVRVAVLSGRIRSVAVRSVDGNGSVDNTGRVSSGIIGRSAGVGRSRIIVRQIGGIVGKIVSNVAGVGRSPFIIGQVGTTVGGIAITAARVGFVIRQVGSTVGIILRAPY